MLIVGLNAFHPDASACVLRDGVLVAAVAEERFGKRQKHCAGFPSRALSEVLRSAGASVSDIDYIAIGHDSHANMKAKVSHVLSSPIKSAKKVLMHLERKGKFEGVHQTVAELCGVPAEHCTFKVISVEHHLAHIASSYFASDFDEAAGFSYDGSGDFTSAMYAHCSGNQIEVLDRVLVPNSLGFFYTAICQFIGFDAFGEEYKVMGLGAFGQPTYKGLMQQIASCDGSGKFRLNRRYFQDQLKNFDDCVDESGEIVLPRLYSQALERLLGAPRARNAEISQRDMDIAASCQLHFEELVLASLSYLHKQVPSNNLVTAGGCALNGVCNARILRETPFTNTYTQCAASDDGTAVGAALYVWNSILNQPRAGAIEHASWGPEYSEEAMEAALLGSGVGFRKLGPDGLLETAAAHLSAGHVAGWYQGKSEWGPRALGNRSILAHPGWPGMKDTINKKVKRREHFRPFAPSILAEEVCNYFEQNIESPFMMHVVRIKEDKRAALSAVCHEDATGRLHTVKRGQNALYYDLIKRFGQKSGTPVVLNTSFNENEPIVDTPGQAVDCFLRTDVDVLCMGPFICVKPGKELPTRAAVQSQTAGVSP